MLYSHKQQSGGGMRSFGVKDRDGIAFAVDDDAFITEARHPVAGGNEGNASRIHIVQERCISGPHGPGADNVDIFDHFPSLPAVDETPLSVLFRIGKYSRGCC